MVSRHARMIALTLTLLVGSLGCKQEPDTLGGVPGTGTAKGTVKAEPVAKAEPKAEPKAAKAGGEGDCDHQDEHASPMLKGKKQTNKKGVEVTHWGEAFADVPTVTVGELRAAPDKYADKQVILQGDVADMCHHRRRWFALVDQKTGAHVRLFTAPRFLMPSGSVGKSVKAQGKVAVFEVAAAQARHISKEHKLGDPNTIKGKVHKELVVRVDVAEIW